MDLLTGSAWEGTDTKLAVAPSRLIVAAMVKEDGVFAPFICGHVLMRLCRQGGRRQG